MSLVTKSLVKRKNVGKLKYLFFCLCCLLMVFSSVLYAREKAPIRFDAFDGGRVGAKAQGMGFAFTAIADNADAPYWNPAGLYRFPGNLFTISLEAVRQSRLSTEEIIKGEPLRGRRLTFISFTGQNGALGFRPMSDIDETVILDPADPDNNYEKRQVKINSFFLSGGSKYNENMYLGLNIHYLNGRLSRVIVQQGEQPSVTIDDGNGYTIDWSMLYRPNEIFNIGVMGQNMPGAIFWGDFSRTILPALFRVGVKIQLPLMTIAYDYEKRFYRDGINRPRIDHIGIEQVLGPYVKIRGGIFGEDLNNSEQVHYTAGLGYIQKGYFVDIAMEKYNQRNADDNVLENVFDYLVSISIPFAAIEPSK